MNYDWKRAVSRAQSHGCGSCTQLTEFSRVKFFIDGDKLMLRPCVGEDIKIKDLRSTSIRSIHVFGTNGATFTKLNAYDTYVVEEFTAAIIRGDVKLTGLYTCANRLGASPSANAIEVPTTVPVPIKVRSTGTYYAEVSPLRVKRGSDRWDIFRTHICSDTSPGEGKVQMVTTRVYMCGGEKENIVSHFTPAVTGVICEPNNKNTYFGACNSGHFQATNMRHLVVRETTGRIGAGIIFFNDECLHTSGIQLIYTPFTRAATASVTLSGVDRNDKPYRCVSASTNCGTTATIWSEYELEPKFWLVDDILAVDPIAWGYTMRSAPAVHNIRNAFGDVGIDECAKLFHSDVRSLAAYFSRGCNVPLPFGGNISHWGRKFNTDGKDRITARPMKFSECLGSTLLKFEGQLYQLYSGKAVWLHLGEDGIWYVTETGPGEVDIPADALVG